MANYPTKHLEERAVEVIKSFEEPAMRKEGPDILNVVKELLQYFQETHTWYAENQSIIDRALHEHGMREAEREEQQEERDYEREQLKKELDELWLRRAEGG